MGGIFKAFKKIAQIAIPAAIAYYTGGTSAALQSVGSSVAMGALSSSPKTSPVTGVTSPASTQSQTQPVDNSAAIIKQEQQKRLALNAGADTPSTNALGVLGKPTVTKKKLLGA